MAFCRNCGHSLGTADRYCSQCGFLQPLAPGAVVGGFEATSMPPLDAPAYFPTYPTAPDPAAPDPAAPALPDPVAEASASTATSGAASDGAPPERGVGVQPALRERSEWYVYRPPRVRATLAQLALGLFILAIGITAIATGDEMGLVQRLERGEVVSALDRKESTDFVEGAFVLYAFTFLLAAPAFLWWLHRAYRNIEGLGAEGLRFSAGWAVGWYFVPIFSLFRPRQVMVELHRASDPEAMADPLQWQRTNESSLVRWWWAQWGLGGTAFAVLASIPTVDLEPHDWLVRDWLFLAADAGIVASAILAMVVIGSVTKRQERRARRLGI